MATDAITLQTDVGCHGDHTKMRGTDGGRGWEGRDDDDEKQCQGWPVMQKVRPTSNAIYKAKARDNSEAYGWRDITGNFILKSSQALVCQSFHTCSHFLKISSTMQEVSERKNLNTKL